MLQRKEGFSLNITQLKTVLLAAQGWAELFEHAVSSGKPRDVTARTQVFILISLELNGKQSIGELSRRLEYAPEQVSRAVKALRKMGFVECNRSDDNHRVILAELTEAGRDQLNEYMACMLAMVGQYMNRLDAPTQEWMLKTAEETVDIMRNRVENENSAEIPTCPLCQQYRFDVHEQAVQTQNAEPTGPVYKTDPTASEDAAMLAETTGGITNTAARNRPEHVSIDASEA